MKRGIKCFLIILLFILSACGGGTNSNEASVGINEVHPIRDRNVNIEVCVFVWNGEKYIDKVDEFIKSLKLNDVNCVLFSSNYIDLYLSEDGRKVFINFIEKIKSAGLKFELVFSRNDWIYPDKRTHLFYLLDLYNEFSLVYGKNIPLNLDIEPHVIDNQENFIDPDIESLYLETLREVRSRVSYLNPVISYVYRYYGLDRKVLNFADTLVVMLYITDLKRIKENVEYYRNITGIEGKGLRIAFSVEKDIVGGDSFYRKSKDLLAEAIRLTAEGGADSVAIQDYEWLMNYLN